MANKDIERALMEALGGSTRPRMRPKGMGGSGRTMSDADRSRIENMMGKSGRTMSDADRSRIENMMGRMPSVGRGVGEADTKISPEQMKLLEQMMQRQQMEQGAAERKAFPPASMMNRGGEVQGYKPGGAVRKKKNKKSKMGCVMPGRGGKYKGIK